MGEGCITKSEFDGVISRRSDASKEDGQQVVSLLAEDGCYQHSAKSR